MKPKIDTVHEPRRTLFYRALRRKRRDGVVATLAAYRKGDRIYRYAALALLALSLHAADRPLTIRDVLDAPSALRAKTLAAYLAQNPKRAHIADVTVPPANRPPVTPGNEHGKRPLVPPGLANYATP